MIENAPCVGIARRKHRETISGFQSHANRRTMMSNAGEKLQHSPYRLTDDLTPRDLQEKRHLTPLINDLFQKKQRPLR